MSRYWKPRGRAGEFEGAEPEILPLENLIHSIPDLDDIDLDGLDIDLDDIDLDAFDLDDLDIEWPPEQGENA